MKSTLEGNSIFKIQGIKAVYLGADFVTITKFAEGVSKYIYRIINPDCCVCRWSPLFIPSSLNTCVQYIFLIHVKPSLSMDQSIYFIPEFLRLTEIHAPETASHLSFDSPPENCRGIQTAAPNMDSQQPL